MSNPTTAISTEPFFDEAEAIKRLTFFPKYLRHSEGARFKGKPFDLLPWEAQIVSDLFGWKFYDPELDAVVRWHTEAFIEVGAKNGKTELGAGLGLSIMAQDGEENGFIFSIASDRDQARIVYNVAKGFVEGHPALRQKIRVPTGRYANWLEHENGNIWRVLPGDEAGNDGEKAIAVFMDEVHRIKNGELYDVMKKSLSTSLQGLFIGMTTAGDERSQLWKERREYAMQVEAGTVSNQRFYSVRFCADPEDPWDDEETWRKANPSLGVTKTLAQMHEMADAARVSPARRAGFKRLHLNIPNQSEDALIDLEEWRSCPSEIDFDSIDGKPSWMGLDLSETTDLSSLCTIIPTDDEVVALWHFWIPEATAARRQREDNVPYIEWAEEGWITLTPGDVVDDGFIRQEVNRLAGVYNVVSIGYDPHKARQFSQTLYDDDGLPMAEVRQGFLTLSSPTKRMLALIAGKRLNHGGNPIASWCAQNTIGKEDENENVRPIKKRSRGRIDGVVALVNAICEWERTGEQPVSSIPAVYDF